MPFLKLSQAGIDLDWEALSKCGDTKQSEEGQALMEASAKISTDDEVSYGLQASNDCFPKCGCECEWYANRNGYVLTCGRRSTSTVSVSWLVVI